MEESQESQLDQPTLRIYLDRLNRDRTNLIARFNEETSKLESLKNGIEHLRGAISYNQNLVDAGNKELEQLSAKAFASAPIPLRDAIASGAKIG